MKLETRNPKPEIAGIMLIECLVYISVFVVLVGLGFAAFYACWDRSKSLRHHADDITRTLRAGERWRADIRSATGPLKLRSADDGQMLEIPRGTNTILYVFTASQVSRKLGTAPNWSVVLPKVKTSAMQSDVRAHATAWRWDVELIPSRPQVRVPPLFTFQAVPPQTP